MKRIKDNDMPIYIYIILCITVGIVLGTTTFHYVPTAVFEEINISFTDEALKINFAECIKDNFLSEIIWVAALWLVNNTSFTSLLSGGITATRGFLVGFSVMAIKTMQSGNEIFTNSILPQTIISMPQLTVFSIILMRLASERKEHYLSDGKYFLIGLILMIITLITSVIEALISMLFIKFI